jgi:vancomycin resistance protein YoaR
MKKLSVKEISISTTIFAVVFTIAVLGQIMIINNYMNGTEPREQFAEGVTISSINVSGLRKDQAEYYVGRFLDERIKKLNLSINYLGNEWNFSGEDFEVEDDVKQIVAEAYRYHQKKLNGEDGIKTQSIIAEEMELDVSFEFLFKDLKYKMDDIIRQIEKEPINAEVTFNADTKNTFKYSKSKKGVKVDRIKLYKDLEKEFNESPTKMVVNINTVSIEPKINKKYLEDKTGLVSIFSTDLHNSKQRRLNNVSLAFSKFNGMVIKPNEQISFNTITVPQTLEGGYERSIVILNGVFVEGVGGGLCQASTTLYNAVILAGLQVDEVNKHTLPIGYIELALDAMVSENWSDFVFTNSSPYNIFIKAYLKNERAYVEIYGKSLENGIKIKRRSEFVRTIPHIGDVVKADTTGEYSSKVIYKGEYFRVKYPREGYEAKAYVQYYSGGKLTLEKEIRHEIYDPQPGLVMEGANNAPKDYNIPDSSVEIIKAENDSSGTTANNVSSILLDNNPTRYNP